MGTLLTCFLFGPPLAFLFLNSPVVPTFHPEFGKYMIESTPGAPYGATLKDLLAVEDNMIWRSV